MSKTSSATDSSSRSFRTNAKYHYHNTRHNVYLPPGYRLESAGKIELRFGGIIIDLYARNFSQGNAVYVELYRKDLKGSRDFEVVKFSFKDSNVPLTKREWGYRGIFPVDPEERPGSKNLSILYSLDGISKGKKFDLSIGKTEFEISKSPPLNLGKYSDVDYQRDPVNVEHIKRSSMLKKEAFSVEIEDMVKDVLSHPRDFHYITSSFWAKRKIRLYKTRRGRKVRLRNRFRTHRGLDLRGVAGSPVFAMADGIIGLAENLFYEGNMIIINHGNRMFSYYMHLNRIFVEKGSEVKAGALIGLVGNSGGSTAAHLHVSFIIRGTHVDPLSFLSLPLR